LIVCNISQVEESTCEVIRFTEKGNLNGKIARRKRDEAGNRLPYEPSQDLDDMGKAKLLEVQW
jgi:23S rRNA maturation-related 3'-5' exoribonuclease YhaM